MKYDIIDILKNDFEKLSASELAECKDLFSSKEEFLALKKSMLMIKSETMKDEITPDIKLKSSLMSEFNQKWQESSSSWFERLVAFILGPSKPLLARPWVVATGMVAVALLVFMTLPLTGDQNQVAMNEETLKEESNSKTFSVPLDKKDEAEDLKNFPENDASLPISGEVLTREENLDVNEPISSMNNKDAEEIVNQSFFSSVRSNEQVAHELQDLEKSELKSDQESAAGSASYSYREAKTLDEVELNQKSKVASNKKLADEKAKAEFSHSDWLDSDKDKEAERQVLSKAKTVILWDLLEPVF